MISVDEMKKLLSDVYGINSPEELDRALEKIGGIDIALFTKERKELQFFMLEHLRVKCFRYGK